MKKKESIHKVKDRQRERKKNLKEKGKGKEQQKVTKKSCILYTASFHALLSLNEHVTRHWP